MNYSKIYYSIIERAQSRTISSVFETHHIIPKCLGGSNQINNLVKLTPREHFICHLLLTKMYTGIEKQKMVYALWAIMNLCNNHQYRKKIKGRIYETVRTEFINNQKSLRGERHHHWGRKTGRTKEDFTPEWKAKISAANKGKTAWNKGIPRPDSVKEAVSNANKGRIPWNKGIKDFKNLNKI